MLRKSLIAATLVSMIVVLAFGPAFAASPFRVNSTTPADGAVNVALNSDVAIVWNRNVDCGTVNATNITISAGGWAVESCGGNQAVFTTSSQVPATTYTVDVSNAVADTNSQAMKNAYSMSYTTDTVDTIGPTVVSTIPDAGAMGVLLDGSVTINWDEDVDCATVTTTSVTSNSPGWVLSSCGGSQAVFATAGQAYSTLYNVTVGTLVTDLATNPMTAPYPFSYTTEAEVLIDADTLDGLDSTDFAAAAHAHAQSDVTGLVTALSDLQATVSTLQSEVAALQAVNTFQQGEIAVLQTTVANQESRIASLEIDSALSPYVDVVQGDLNGATGPHVIFTGVNLHLRANDFGGTSMINGLGNLIIGHNEVPWSSNPQGNRNGSHNLVLGSGNNYSKWGGIVNGTLNELLNNDSAIIGGESNRTYAYHSVIAGGQGNMTNGNYSFIGGSSQSETMAGGRNAAVVGSYHSYADNFCAFVGGGQWNTASGLSSSVTGGFANTAYGDMSSISGGESNVTGDVNDSRIGKRSSVSGGLNVLELDDYGWSGGTYSSP